MGGKGGTQKGTLAHTYTQLQTISNFSKICTLRPCQKLKFQKKKIGKSQFLNIYQEMYTYFVGQQT